MAKLKPKQLDISTGSTDNDTVTTKGYVDEHSQNAIWTLSETEVSLTTLTNTIKPDAPLHYTSHPTFSLDTQLVDKQYVDDTVAFYAEQEIIPVTFNGETVFTLSQTPSGATALGLWLNGQLRNNPTDYGLSGDTITWNDPGGITLKTTDVLTAWYDYTSVAPSSYPLFLAYSFSNILLVTGDGTEETVGFDTTEENRGNNYDTVTNIFTAPFAGVYNFDWDIHLRGFTSSNDFLKLSLQVNTTDFPCAGFNPQDIFNVDTDLILNGSFSVKLETSDLVSMQLLVSGESYKNIQVQAQSIFNGWLITV